jgi:hypothetical protein
MQPSKNKLVKMPPVNGVERELHAKMMRLIHLSRHIENLFRLYSKQMEDLSAEVLDLRKHG